MPSCTSHFLQPFSSALPYNLTHCHQTPILFVFHLVSLTPLSANFSFSLILYSNSPIASIVLPQRWLQPSAVLPSSYLSRSSSNHGRDEIFDHFCNDHHCHNIAYIHWDQHCATNWKVPKMLWFWLVVVLTQFSAIFFHFKKNINNNDK